MNFILAFLLRELRRIKSHKGFLFLVTCFPLLLGLIFGRIYTARVVTGMPVAVLDEDRTQLSRLIIRYLDATRGLRVLVNVESIEQIEQLIADGEIAVGVLIPRHLERSIKRSEAATVIAYVDASNITFANQANADLRTVIGTVAAGIQLKYLRKTGSSTKRALAQIQAVRIEPARLYNPGFNYMNYLTPGLWASMLFQLLVLFGSLAFAREFEMGRGPELWELADHSTWKLLLGKLIPYVLIGTILFAGFFLGIFPLFQIAIETSGFKLLLFSILLVLAALSLGMALSSLGKSTLGALKGVLLLTGSAFSLSGYIWPLEAMPLFLQGLAQVIPLTPYLAGYRKLFQEGADLSAIGPEATHLLGLALLGLLAAYWGLRKGRATG